MRIRNMDSDSSGQKKIKLEAIMVYMFSVYPGSHGNHKCGFGEVCETRMWVNAQRDGRPAEHRCRPVFNAAKLIADAH